MHRMLPVPERVSRDPRSRGEQAALLRAADVHPARGVGHAPARYRRPAGFRQDEAGLGLCNITKCCTEVCPEHITITDNAIIPMKERVAGNRYDPVVWLGRKIFRRKSD